MNLVPSRKSDDLLTLRSEFDGLLNRCFAPDFTFASRLPATFQKASVPVDVAETEKSWTLSFEMPGLNEKDIQVQILGRQLVVSAERKWDEEKKGKEFHRVESQYGTFQRSIELPQNARLEPDSLTATYKKGVLEVIVPKVEPTPAAKIAVKAG